MLTFLKAVRFQMSQIGDDYSAMSFLEGLRYDEAVEDVLFCTSRKWFYMFSHIESNYDNLHSPLSMDSFAEYLGSTLY